MEYPPDQLAELKELGEVELADESGIVWVRIKGLKLPTGCAPSVADVLLCPTQFQGYESRLFFSQQIEFRQGRSWNGSVHVLGANWVAFSWRVTSAGKRLAQLLAEHLAALR